MFANTLSKHKNFLLGIVYLSFFIIYFLQGLLLLDPDFGWHLRFGEIILQTKSIPKLDIFSYTMPSYKYIDHEWLNDLFIAAVYPFTGMGGLAVFFSFIVSLGLFIQTRIVRNRFALVPLLLSATSLLTIVLVRPQLFNILFFTLIISTLLNLKTYHKYRYFIPFIFLLWANLHGGFLVGIIIYALFLAVKFIQKQKLEIGEVFIFAVSVTATFINPYGLDLWKEVFRSGTDLTLRFRTEDWIPTFLFINYSFIVLSVLSVIIFIKYFNKFSHFEKVLFVFLFVFGMSSERNIIFFIPIAAIICAKGFNFFYVYVKNRPFNQKRLMFAYNILIVLCFVILVLSLVSEVFSLSSSQTERVLVVHPQAAVAFLEKHSSSGQVFSIYAWGGYLIWKMPDKKVFIDGRMTIWINNNAPSSESKEAFREMQQIGIGQITLETEIRKYNIDTFLFPSDFSKSENLNVESKLLYQLLNIKEFNSSDIERQLKDLGFKVVYKDSIAVIYRKF